MAAKTSTLSAARQKHASAAQTRPTSAGDLAKLAIGFPKSSTTLVGDRALLIAGDALSRMHALADAHPDGLFEMIFADPPYLLSNGGISCKNGQMVSVDKGAWDKSRGYDKDYAFVHEWVSLCQRLLTRDGTLWVSGTHHVIFMVGHAMQATGMRILNNITWEKPNPPPNLSCRYFTHSTEIVLWAAKNKKSKHYFDYKAMKRANGGKQMKDVWRMTAPGKAEKTFGKHPTQKPIELMRRIVRASTRRGGLILDPFAGSFTTGVAALELGRKCVGIEREKSYVRLGIKRATSATPQSRNTQRGDSGKSRSPRGTSKK
jgi:site-specific DNA-methyltransferase (adenine-specific)